MSPSTHMLVLHADKEAAFAVQRAIDQEAGNQSKITERRNLDGDTATWIIIAGLVNQALPHILDLVKTYLASRQVQKIKVGDIEIENPRPEDIELLRKRISGLA